MTIPLIDLPIIPTIEQPKPEVINYPIITIDGEYKITTYENGVAIKEYFDPNVNISVDSKEPEYSHLIDIGAFFDRFGAAKFQVLTSSDPIVKAILTDVSVRKWIDLHRPDVEQALNIIATKCDQITPELIQAILFTPVADIENLSLRKLYFGA